MFRRGPLTCADDGQSGAVNDEVPAGARAGAPKRAGEMLTASRERGVIGCREIDAQHLEDRCQETLGRLAVRGQQLGRRVVMQVAGIVTPDPILRWYRRLIAQTYAGSARRGRGRPMPRRDVAARVVRMAVEHPQWGYTRIRGALSNLGHEIARTTVKRTRHDHGIDPAPERSRRMPWKTFLQAPWEGRTACDRFTVEVLTLVGLQRYLVFFVIALQSRRVTIAGIPPQPYGAWMEQMARNLTDPVDGCLRRARYLIHDRDPLDTRGFGEILEGGGVQPIRLPPKSPNLNAYAERFVRSMKEECLSRVVPLGEGHVRLLVGEYVEHSHRERNHQGLDNQLLQRPPPPVSLAADVQRRERLGGSGARHWPYALDVLQDRGSADYRFAHLSEFTTGSEARTGIGGWMDFYNRCRPHSSLNGRTPEEAYTSDEADRSLGLRPTSGQPNAA